MPTVYKLYEGERKWVCASGFFDIDEGYSKEEAQKILKGEPDRCIVDVYDVTKQSASKNVGHGYTLVCCKVVWKYGKRAVAASNVTDNEKKQMLHGQIGVGCYVGSALRTNVFLKALLTDFSPSWQIQLDEAFGPTPYKVDIRSLNGHIFAIGKDKKQVEILP